MLSRDRVIKYKLNTSTKTPERPKILYLFVKNKVCEQQNYNGIGNNGLSILRLLLVYFRQFRGKK
jgi:hypothetical protein